MGSTSRAGLMLSRKQRRSPRRWTHRSGGWWAAPVAALRPVRAGSAAQVSGDGGDERLVGDHDLALTDHDGHRAGGGVLDVGHDGSLGWRGGVGRLGSDGGWGDGDRRDARSAGGEEPSPAGLAHSAVLSKWSPAW